MKTHRRVVSFGRRMRTRIGPVRVDTSAFSSMMSIVHDRARSRVGDASRKKEGCALRASHYYPTVFTNKNHNLFL